MGMDWSDWAIPLFSALLGAGVGGGLGIYAGARVQRQANANSLRLAAAQAIADDCFELSCALASYDVRARLAHTDLGQGRPIPSETLKECERLISRILIWAEDGDGIHDRFQDCLQILMKNFASPTLSSKRLISTFEERTKGYREFREGVQVAVARLPRDGEPAFNESVDRLLEVANQKIAH